MRISTNREDGMILFTGKPIHKDIYETAISTYGKYWMILEGYDTKEQALCGHVKYVNISKDKITDLIIED